VKEALTQIENEKPKKPDYRNPYVLHYLHWIDGLSTYEMAELLGKSQFTIRYWLGKHGIARRSISEAIEKYPKKSFSGNPEEKAYMVGLRAGDLHIYKIYNNIVCQTTTSHPAMRRLIRRIYGVYGHYHEYPLFVKKANQYEWRVKSYLDSESFGFLLKKPVEVTRNHFYPFLAGYIDAEGVWDISKSGGYLKKRFSLKTTDYKLLEQIKQMLEKEGYHPTFRPTEQSKSSYSFGSGKQMYAVRLNRQNEVVSLAERILPYTQHEEKIDRIKLVLEFKSEKYWVNVKHKVIALRKKINKERDECVEKAEEEHKKRCPASARSLGPS